MPSHGVYGKTCLCSAIPIAWGALEMCSATSTVTGPNTFVDLGNPCLPHGVTRTPERDRGFRQWIGRVDGDWVHLRVTAQPTRGYLIYLPRRLYRFN